MSKKHKTDSQDKDELITELTKLRQRITELEAERKQTETELKEYQLQLEQMVAARTAGLRVVESQWEGEDTYLASLRDITERKQTERQLRFQAQLLDSVRESVVATDLEGHVIYWGKGAEALYGYRSDEVMGKLITFIVDPLDEQEEQQRIEQVRESGTWQGQYIQKRKDGSSFWADTFISLVADQDGQPYGLIGLDRDITNRKRMEVSIQEYNRDLVQLNQASQALNATLDLDQVLTTILDEMCRLLDVMTGSVWLIDPESNELVCRQATGPHAELVRNWRLTPGQGLAGWVVQHKENVLVPDVESDPRHFKGVDQRTGLALRSILGVPLRVKQNVIGLLQAVSPEVERFSNTDKILLELLATTASIAIENAQLYEQARQDAETKARLLHEVNHRVKNNLASIIGLIYAERRHEGMGENEAYQGVMQNLINRVQGLAIVHNLLSNSEWTSVSLSELIAQITRSALQGLPPHKRVQANIPASPVLVTPKQANSLALIINELATNTIKHTLPGRDLARIATRIETDHDTVLFEFRDDGPGYPAAVLEGEAQNMGLYLIQNMVQKDLGGELFLHNDEGALTQIRFKLMNDKPQS